VKKRSLNVFVDDKLSGNVARSDVEEDTFLFTYAKDVSSNSAVSLTMPPRVDPYDSMAGLLPIFEMNLPEGGLKDRLRSRFAKAIPEFDDLDMLAIVGSSQIGRLRFSHEDKISAGMPEEDIEKMLTYRGSEDLFAELLEKFAEYSGISGMQPKVLVREMGQPEKVIRLGATHIVKSFNPAEYPELAANEAICTAGAVKAGLRTANVTLSENRNLLVVERFDRKHGKYLGIEDFCVLSGRRAHGRYDGSYEDIAKRITNFVTPSQIAKAKEQFALMIAYACVVENGDAHLKNFSVIYEDTEATVSLSPAYDLVSTTPYLTSDTLALTMNGSKQFPDRKSLLGFIREVTGRSEKSSGHLIDKAIAGAETAIDEAKEYERRYPDAKIFVEAMTKSIGRGIDRLKPV
jgi:serine/threonine-protein kinase HipA